MIHDTQKQKNDTQYVLRVNYGGWDFLPLCAQLFLLWGSV